MLKAQVLFLIMMAAFASSALGSGSPPKHRQPESTVRDGPAKSSEGSQKNNVQNTNVYTPTPYRPNYVDTPGGIAHLKAYDALMYGSDSSSKFEPKKGCSICEKFKGTSSG
jgi:hypothetical protein